MTWGCISFKQDFSGSKATLALYKSPPAVELQLERQRQIYLDRPREFCISMRIGPLSLSDCKINIDSRSPELLFDSTACGFSSGVQATKVSIALPDASLGVLEAGGSYELTLPYDATLTGMTTKLLVTMQYAVDGKMCSTRRFVEADLSLPLSVNVQDFFRMDR